MPSEVQNVIYQIALNEDGQHRCLCPSKIFKADPRFQCKHILAARYIAEGRGGPFFAFVGSTDPQNPTRLYPKIFRNPCFNAFRNKQRRLLLEKMNTHSLTTR